MHLEQALQFDRFTFTLDRSRDRDVPIDEPLMQPKLYAVPRVDEAGIVDRAADAHRTIQFTQHGEVLGAAVMRMDDTNIVTADDVE